MATTTQRKPAAMYGITRSRSRSGWKVGLRREGVTLFKMFCDSTCGGEQSALAHAQVWRDQMVKKHPPIAREQRANKLRRNNKTGIPGVMCRMGPDGKPSMWVVRTYLGPGNVLTKAFGVSRHGAEAKLLAIAERQAHLQHMAGLVHLHPAEAALRQSQPRPLPANCPVPLDRAEIVRPGNRSGIPGVAYRKAHANDPGRWVATTYISNGRTLTKSFPVRRHGEEPAKALAVAERQKHLRQKKKKG